MGYDAQNILAIDTALGATSIAICRGGEQLASHYNDERNTQATYIHSWIEQSLLSAGMTYGDIDLISTSIGPGGFTGIRIGLTTARSLAYAARKPILGFSTLEVMASYYIHRGNDGSRLLSVVPAGRGRYFVQFFRGGEAISEPEVVTDYMLGDYVRQCDIAISTRDISSHIDNNGYNGKLIGHNISDNAYILSQLAHRKYMGLATDGAKGEFSMPAPLYIRPADAKKQKPLLSL